MSGNWLYEISGLIAVSAADVPNITGGVRLRCGEFARSIRLADGQILAGDSACSEILGDEDIFKDLAAGRISLQAAFSAGRVSLSGDPEPLLRLAMVLSGRTANLGPADVTAS
jgi:hypothetical protein